MRRHVPGGLALLSLVLLAGGLLTFWSDSGGGQGWFTYTTASEQTAFPAFDVLWTWQQLAGALLATAGLVVLAGVAGYAVGRGRAGDQA